jgi:signal transduction histidine kinase
MVQEALTNIGKYAKASKVLVSIHGYPTHVAIQVRDNGSGFDPASVRPTSHGLSGMRHRVESAGGRLTITSRPGDGTLVSAVLPLQAKPGAAAAPLPKPAET